MCSHIPKKTSCAEDSLRYTNTYKNMCAVKAKQGEKRNTGNKWIKHAAGEASNKYRKI